VDLVPDGRLRTALRLGLCGALLLATASLRGEEVGAPQTHGDENDGWHLRRQGYRLEAALTRGFSASCDLREALRYTPVGGLQAGLLCTWRRERGEGRNELLLDTGFGLGIGSANDWLLGPRLRFSSGPLAELGVQLHALTDSGDMWRTGRLQSSLSFALQNRPDAEFFRRTGLAAFATARPIEHLLVGAEYHLDEYASLATRDGIETLPGDDEVAWRNPAVEPGRIGSVVLRAEWSAAAITPAQIGNVWRQPELSLLGNQPRTGVVSFRSLNTLEIARPELGGDRKFAFTRLVSDHVLVANEGFFHGLRLRLRLGGAWGAPPQKQEALGGWSALRGYPFKRYRGSVSLLGVAEYRRSHAAAFVDIGGVRELAGWSGLMSSVGVRVYFWRDLNLSLAWRASGPGRQAFPSVRLLLSEGW
jgi:hypothetical protein